MLYVGIGVGVVGVATVVHYLRVEGRYRRLRAALLEGAGGAYDGDE